MDGENFMENPMKIHDLGVFPLFLETPIYEQNPVGKNMWRF